MHFMYKRFHINFLKPLMEMFKSRAYYKWQFTMFSTVFPHMVQYLTMSILVYM